MMTKSKRLLREYFVRCSHGTTPTHARATAVGVLLFRGPQADRLDQLPMLQHVQIRVQHKVHCQQHVRRDRERPYFLFVHDESGQQYRRLWSEYNVYTCIYIFRTRDNQLSQKQASGVFPVDNIGFRRTFQRNAPRPKNLLTYSRTGLSNSYYSFTRH